MRNLYQYLKQLITEMKHNILNIKEESYYSKLDLDTIKNKIEKLYEQKKLRLGGGVINNKEFTVYDKLVIVGWNIPNLRRKSAYAKGEIIASETGTIIKLTIKPNFLLPAFAIFSALAGIVITSLAFYTQGNMLYKTLGFTFIALGTLYYPLSTHFRNRLQNKIVKHLDLSNYRNSTD